MPNIEELREDLKALRMQYGTNQSTIEGAGLLNEICDVYLAAIEDAQRYKKDENGVYWFKTSGGYTILYYWEELPAAVRAVLEVTGGGE